MWALGVITGEAGARRLVRELDDLDVPESGKARVRPFHSIEWPQGVDISVELLDSGSTLDLWSKLHPGGFGDPWEMPAGTAVLRVSGVD
jgi:hypothetical protein